MTPALTVGGGETGRTVICFVFVLLPQVLLLADSVTEYVPGAAY